MRCIFRISKTNNVNPFAMLWHKFLCIYNLIENVIA